jgi:rod shape-determining protein MreD
VRAAIVPTTGALLGAVLLQVAIAPRIAVFGVVPDLLLLVVITLALVEGPTAGAVVGFAAGLLTDLVATGPIGPSALVLSLVGYFAGSLSASLFAEGWWLPVIVVSVATLVAGTAYMLMLVLLGQDLGPLGAVFLSKVLPGAVYDTVLAVLVYPWLARLLRREQFMTTLRGL